MYDLCTKERCKMMKRFVYILLVVGLCACSTTQRVGKTKAAEEKAPWHTYRMDRAQAKVEIDGQVIYSDCSIQAVYDSLIVVSLKPVLGLEAYRLEVNKDGVRIIDRLQQRYTEADYKLINSVLRPPMSLRTWQEWLTTQTKEVKPLTYSALGHTVTVEVNTSAIAIDEGARPKQADMTFYQNMNIMKFMSEL